VLIAGQGSFIGGAVERRLSEFPERYAVAVADTRGADWKGADLSGFDSVVHVAGIAHVSPRPEMRPLYEAVNRDLAIETAHRARAAGVRQFVFLSSSIVFGSAAPAGRSREIAPLTQPAPANAYGQSKLDAEIGIRALEDGHFRAAILRPMMVFGAGGRGNYARLSHLVARAPLFPDFPNRRGAVYVEHLAELIRLLIDDGAGGTFHPQDAIVSTADFAREIAAARGKKLALVRAFNPLVRLFGRADIVRRAFGGFHYRADMADCGRDWRALPFAECVRRTEGFDG
jgi:nucleoside-diphosphate-sugar epimerase